jgi:hypothetical protein
MILVDKKLVEGKFVPDIPIDYEFKLIRYNSELDKYEVYPKQQQIAKKQKRAIDFKLRLLENHNLTDDDILAGIDQHPTLTTKQKEALKLRYQQSPVILKNDPDILALAPAFNLTPTDIDNLFK